MACKRAYRMIIVRKHIQERERGQLRFLPNCEYLFYITNDWTSTPAEIVFSANDRCNQENLVAQLGSGVRALRAPVDNLMSNWAYMVMASLAWNLKAWLALWTPPPPGRWHAKHKRRAGRDVADGVSHVCFVFHSHSLPDHQHGSQARVPIAGVECLARCLLSHGRPILLARCAADEWSLEAGVWMLRSAAAPNPESNHTICATKTCFVPTPRDGPPQSVRTHVLAYLSDRSDRWAFACLRPSFNLIEKRAKDGGVSGDDHCPRCGGCSPRARDIRRTRIICVRFIRNAATVARPAGVSPTISVLSSLHAKWSGTQTPALLVRHCRNTGQECSGEDNRGLCPNSKLLILLRL